MESAQKEWRKGTVLAVAIVVLVVIVLLAIFLSGRKRPVAVVDSEVGDGGAINLIVNSCNEDPELSSIETVGDIARVVVVANTGNNEDCLDSLAIELEPEVVTVFDRTNRSSFFVVEPANGKWDVAVSDAGFVRDGVVSLGVNSCFGDPELASIEINGEVATVRAIADQGNIEACQDGFPIRVDAGVTRILDAVSGEEFTIRAAG